MAGADVAGIHLVVVEVLAVQRPRLVADQAIFGDARRIELDLELHVPGDGEERGARLLHQRLLRLGERVDIGGRAVAVLRQRLHQAVIVVAAAEAEHGEEDAALAARFDEALQVLVARRADIEVAVRRQHDAVDAVLPERFLRQPVGRLDALRAGRRAARLEIVDGVEDLFPLLRRGRLQHHAGIAGIGDDRHRVRRLQLADQEAEGALQERQLVRRVHGAGDVDEEDEVGGRFVRRHHVEALDADMQELRALVPRRRHDGYGRLERLFRRLGSFPVVGEIIDQLLDTHGIGVRQAAGQQRAADIGIGGRIDIRREGGDRIGRDALHRVRIGRGEALAVFRRQRHGIGRLHRHPAQALHGGGPADRQRFRHGRNGLLLAAFGKRRGLGAIGRDLHLRLRLFRDLPAGALLFIRRLCRNRRLRVERDRAALRR